jgi:hypothetical protein
MRKKAVGAAGRCKGLPGSPPLGARLQLCNVYARRPLSPRSHGVSKQARALPPDCRVPCAVFCTNNDRVREFLFVGTVGLVHWPGGLARWESPRYHYSTTAGWIRDGERCCCYWHGCVCVWCSCQHAGLKDARNIVRLSLMMIAWKHVMPSSAMSPQPFFTIGRR